MSERRFEISGAGICPRLPAMLLRAYSQALSHQLRSPLSVISNDLNYFKKKEQCLDYDRALRKCAEISDLLSEAGCSGKSLHRSETIELDRILQRLLQEKGESYEFKKEGVDFSIKADPEQIVLALEYLLVFPGALPVLHKSYRLLQEPTGLGLLSQTTLKPARSELAELSDLHLSSFTEMSASLSNDETLKSVRADAAIWAHNGRTTITYKDEILSTLIFFYSEE